MTLGAFTLGGETLAGPVIEFPDVSGFGAIIAPSAMAGASAARLGVSLDMPLEAASAVTVGNISVRYQSAIFVCETSGVLRTDQGDDINSFTLEYPACAQVGDFFVLYTTWVGDAGAYVSRIGGAGIRYGPIENDSADPDYTNIYSQIAQGVLSVDDIAEGEMVMRTPLGALATGARPWMIKIFRGVDYEYSTKENANLFVIEAEHYDPPEIPSAIGGALEDDISVAFAAIPADATWSAASPYTGSTETSDFPSHVFSSGISFGAGHYVLPADDSPHEPARLSWTYAGTPTVKILTSVGTLLRPSAFTYTASGLPVSSPSGTVSGAGTVQRAASGVLTAPAGAIAGSGIVTASGGEVEVCDSSANAYSIADHINSVSVTASENSVTVEASQQDVC